MKAFAFLLLLSAGFAVQQANAVTIGEVLTGLCPEASAAINGDYTILQNIGAAIADVEIDIPDGVTPILIAPSDTAFIQALGKLGLSAEEALANTALLTSVISLHLAGASSPDATTATTLSGGQLRLLTDNQPTTLAGFIESELVTSIAYENQIAGIVNVIACPGGVVATFSDSVLIPAVIPSTEAATAPALAPIPEIPVPAPAPEPVPAPIPAPEPAPAPTPAPAPISSAAAATFGLATAVAMVAAIFA